jgi:hypothetical protein
MLAIENLKEKKIKPLGRPSLEGWVKQVQEVNKADALQKVGFNEKNKVVTFIGGYGALYSSGVDDAYASAKQKLSEAGYQVHMQYHPNVMKQQPLTTIEAVGMADFIVCYDSTVGFEALFVGKKVIYLQPENVPPYNNIAIQNQLAESVQSNEELLKALSSSPIQTQDVYKVLGVERNSTKAITEYILQKLHKALLLEI